MIDIPKETIDRLLLLRRKFFRTGDHDSEGLQPLFIKYLKKRKKALADSLIASANLSIHIFEGEPDPLALEAIRMTNPNFDPSQINDYSDEQLMGIVNSAKGKYFELLVAEKLNNGEQVGDLVLPDGYHAELAESMNQPGWDLTILGPSGSVAEHLQLKATDNFGYISEALEKYPDIRILAADEAANSAPDGYTMVLDSEIPDSDLTDAINSTLDVNDSGFLDRFTDTFHPLFPLAVIAALEGYSVYAGKQQVSDAIKSGSERAGRSLFSTLTGSVVFALGGGLLAIPAAFTAGMWYRRLNSMRKLNDIMQSHITRMREISMSIKKKKEWLKWDS